MRSAARVCSPLVASVVIALVALAGPVAATSQDGPTSPGEFFGFELGADRKLARWDRIVEYFELLEGESDRIRVVDMGPSTEGHPFLLVVVSSPDNLAEAGRLQRLSRRLADPRGASEVEIEEAIADGKAVVAQSLGLHSTEVAGAQSAPLIAWDLVSRDDPDTRRILDETVLVLLPCLNPDGQIMVTDWYRRWVGTDYEGARLPWLYHKYVGHDNNRDGDYLHMVESQYTAEVLYRDWKPQAYVDHHQMGSYGARFYVPPYSEPIRPGADPLMWRELSWYGAHIAYKLEEHGKTGVLNAAQYPGWGHFGWHWITPFHNIAGMLTESASATLATPLYIHPDQLRGGARGLPEYEAQSNMPNPWPGGWWSLADIVEQQVIAARALQDIAARNRETILRNAYLKARRQVERGGRGADGLPLAYVVPARQHDPLTAVDMVDTLLKSDVEIHRAGRPFTVDGMTYGAGSFVIPMAQPKQGLVRNLMGRTFYPDNEWTRARDGSPLRPYDTATHTMSEFMGVRVDPVDVDPTGTASAWSSGAAATADGGGFERLTPEVPVRGGVAEGAVLALDGRRNASFRAVNLLLDVGATVRRVDRPVAGLRPGDFVLRTAEAGDADLGSIASETGVEFRAVEEATRLDPAGDPLHDLQRLRVGMYQRYLGGNMDEGWTRFLLEEFGFPYTSIMDAEIQAGGLRDGYDVIVLPHDDTAMIVGDPGDSPYRPRLENIPPEYRSGLGDDGIAALREFVEAGGTLVTLGRAADFAIEKFELPIRDAVAGLDSKEFFCPGSTLRMSFDVDQPLAYGMPSEGFGLFWDSPVFEILPTPDNHRYETVARYVERDILQSGWLIGEEHLSEKAAVVSAGLGDGRVVLIGIRAQHRAQTDGTFKLLFNALLR